MAETAITAVLSKLGEFATKEAALLLQVGDDIVLLRDRLEWLQAFIRDADRKRRVGADDLTRVWVRQTRDVAFEAEDALDDFFHKVDIASQNYRGWKMVLRYLTGFRTQITVRHGLSGRINRIKSRLDQISENQKEYKIDHSPSGIWTSSTTALAPWDDLRTIVGREEDAKTVRELLLHKEHPQQMFISVLGESGVGKKTLTMAICNDEDMRNKFDVCVWYNMPPDSSMEDLLEEVYKRAYEYIHKQNEAPQEKGIDIVDKLRDLLTDKRYLVILGGISSKTILNCVGASLPDDKKGSRVLLILEPESEEVAWHADTLNLQRHDIKSIHRLSRLDAKTSGKLFRSRVFAEPGKDTKDTKEKTYEAHVFDVTQGHPLAIVVLAGLLRYKEKPVEWDAMLQVLRPGMEDAEDSQDNPITGLLLLNERRHEWWKALQQQMAAATETKLSNRMVIERIMSASFDDLPQDIKSCFLYFAAYSMNVSLSADNIVRMWTAEGFIKPQKGRSLEELGHSYLKELVSRCLVELTKKNAWGGIESVMVHNRLLRFLQSEAREASFIEVHDRNDILAPASVRRLSIQDDSGTYATFSNKFPKLRSFICRVAGEIQSSDKSTSQSKKARREFPCGPGLTCVISRPVREGVGSSNLKSHDMKFLCGSKFLRLLSVQGLRLEELPDEIGDMIHLRYLRVECPGLKKLPRSIRRLLNLQTLDISKTAVVEIHPHFWKIKTLRHVLAEKLTLPTSLVNELAELQTLHGIVAGEGKWDQGKSPLDKMAKLQSLELHGFNAASHGSALEGALSNMHLLGRLKLEGDVIPSCLFTGPILRRLQTMELDGAAKWPVVRWDIVHKVRPNLVGLKLTNSSQVPKELLDEMKAQKLMLPF